MITQPFDIKRLQFYTLSKYDTEKKCRIAVGELGEVMTKMLDIAFCNALDCNQRDRIRFIWDVHNGAIITLFHKKDKIINIEIMSATPPEVIHNLYVQLHELLDVVMFDPRIRKYLSPQKFKLSI